MTKIFPKKNYVDEKRFTANDFKNDGYKMMPAERDTMRRAVAFNANHIEKRERQSAFKSYPYVSVKIFS